MLAAVITRPGGPEVLEIQDVPPPTGGEADVLVRVRASALNRADILQRIGGYAAPPGSPAQIPGLEYAGEILELGKAVRGFQPGDRVFGIAGGGAHAEMIAIPARTVARVPSGLSWTDAGAIPEAFITAHDALVTQGRMGTGDRVLIHAVGSGVGLAAVQVARAFGAIPFGTSRTADKIDRELPYGLERGAVLTDAKALPAIAREWAPDGFDVVLDLVGGPYTPANVETLRSRGRIMKLGVHHQHRRGRIKAPCCRRAGVLIENDVLGKPCLGVRVADRSVDVGEGVSIQDDIRRDLFSHAIPYFGDQNALPCRAVEKT